MATAAAPVAAAVPTGAPDAAFAGCEHYSRKCQLLSACCDKFYTCRFCHDAVEDEGQRDVKKRHTMDRHAVRTVKCMPCGAVQPAAQVCTSCGVTLGAYFCPRCNLFDDKPRGQWHCDGCGICRVGGPENFRHCDRCAVCIGVSMWATHTCVTDRLKVPCPICYEDLHSSRDATSFLPCGHSMHARCWTNMLRSGNAKCPMCSKTTVDMSREWNERDLCVLASPMPREYAHVWLRVLCNDCHTESDARFHLDGFKCANVACGGYNTRKIGSAVEAHPASAEEEAPAATESFNIVKQALQQRHAAVGAAAPATPEGSPSPTRMSLRDVLHKIGRDAGGYSVEQRTELLMLLQARSPHHLEGDGDAIEEEDADEEMDDDAADEDDVDDDDDADVDDDDDLARRSVDDAAFLSALRVVMAGAQQLDEDADAAAAEHDDDEDVDDEAADDSVDDIAPSRDAPPATDDRPAAER